MHPASHGHDKRMSRLAAPTTHTNAPGPSAAEAGGTLTIDLAADRGELARAVAPHCSPVECAAVVKANAYGCGTRAGRRRARQGRLQDVLRRRSRRSAARARVRAGRRRSTCSTVSCPARRRAFAELNARPVINSIAELAEWDAFVAANGWRGGAALHVDTGMNRLGISPAEAAALAPRLQARKPRHHAADEPSRLRRDARPSAQRAPDRAVSRNAHALSRHPRLARQFVRHLPRRRRALRPGAARARRSTASIRRPAATIRCAPVVELSGRICRSARCGKGETVGYGAHLDRQARRRASRSSRSAMPTAICARPAAPTTARGGRRPSSPASAARSSAASRWT